MAVTTVDFLAAEFMHGPLLKMASNVTILEDGTSNEFVGTSDLEIDEFFELLAGGTIAGKRGNSPVLTLILEGRNAVEDSYTTAHTYNVTANGKLDTVKITSPKKRYRLRWTITGTNPRYVLTSFFLSTELSYLLPSTVGKSEGDVLTLDSGLNPQWVTP